MTLALRHPLVREYLARLEAALAGMPSAEADELREQINAHLSDALPDGADEAAIHEVLDRLGTPQQILAAAPYSAARRPRFWRRHWKILAGAAGLLVVCLVLSLVLILPRVNAEPLQCGCGGGWVSTVDQQAEVRTSADGRTQGTVPDRPDAQQAYDASIVNDSPFTETVLGQPKDQLGLLVDPYYTVQITTRDNGNETLADVGFSDRFPISIPPHGVRTVRILWSRQVCQGPGDSGVIDSISLRVRVGWFTRTQNIQLVEAIALIGAPNATCPS